ncbi:MAG TPA: sulfotransferase [Rhizomicrobium sp.]|nr:sulfotransferase [Rhizomicrobium sp.]
MSDFDSAAEALRPGRGAKHPRLREAARLFADGKPGAALKPLKEFLGKQPDDPVALHLMGEIALAQGRDDAALGLMTRALQAAPGLAGARYSRASILLRRGEAEAALADATLLLADDASNPRFRVLKAMALEAVEDYAASAELWLALAQDFPDAANCWTRAGNALRLLGRREEAVAAYRRAIAADPSSGDPWWGLADLKTYRFDDAEVAAMEAQLQRPGLAPEDRVRLHFALGKACADRGSYETAFGHYAKGNALHRLGIKHDPAVLSAYVARAKQVFTPEFFARREGYGAESDAPIFIVGMMRAGSTLVEQILASHSQVEATRELSDLAAVSLTLQTGSYWDALQALDRDTATELGKRYLAATASHRKLGRAHFLDKMGANFAQAGLIRLILPQAKIVDVRRHPLACGFSIFSQLFPSGQNDSYRLAEIGRLYRDYVELMAHFETVLPVHRVIYEELVTDPEREIRRLLDHLGLPFEAACLDFHKSGRVVTTVSSEQVRRPIYKSALEQWRHFEPWLGPLAESLGPVLAAYPSVPEEWR